MPQKSCKEKPVIFSGKGYYITREDTRNVGLYVFSENKVLFKGYFNTIEAALSSLVTNSLLVDETWTMKEQIISDIKQYFTDQASNSLDDLEEDELFN